MLKTLLKKQRKKSIFTILDIGSTKIICLIAHIKQNGMIKIIGIGHSESSGFKAGVITDKKLAETSLITAIEIAEKMCKESIDKIIAIVSASGLKTHHIKSQLKLPGHIITDRDVSNLLGHTLEYIDENKYEIINYTPLEYSLDNVNGVENPVGLFGYDLKTCLQITTLPLSLVYNLINVLADCHLDIEEVISSPFAASFACLTNDEKDIGITLIDFGGATTSFAVFARNKLIYSAVIPLGGMNITSDIAHSFSISHKNAERIKTLYGSAIVTFADNYKMIDIPVIGEDHEMYSISNANLNNIIAARIEEILEIVRDTALQADIDRSYLSRVVLTGGGSLLTGIKEVTINIFKSKVRVAKPILLEGLNSEDELSTFSPAIGALQYISERSQQNSLLKESSNQSDKSFTRQVLDWVKENL